MGGFAFHDMGRTVGVSRKYLPPADDGASVEIGIPTGFAFGTATNSLVYVRITTHCCVYGQYSETMSSFTYR